jgi:hypothetical protein
MREHPMEMLVILLGRSKACKSGSYFPQRLWFRIFVSAWSTFSGGNVAD